MTEEGRTTGRKEGKEGLALEGKEGSRKGTNIY